MHAQGFDEYIDWETASLPSANGVGNIINGLGTMRLCILVWAQGSQKSALCVAIPSVTT